MDIKCIFCFNRVQIWLTFAPILTTKLSTMAFDIEMIKNLYAAMPAKVEAARKLLNRPLTLSEKILFSHLHTDQNLENFERGGSYVDFAPDRVAMQDATAQMALLQFMQAGRPK